MQQILSELREYVKQLRKFDDYAARKQCALISPLEKALRVLIEQKGIHTGSAKPHYEKKYAALYNALKMAVNYPSYYNYFLPLPGYKQGELLDILLVKVPVPTKDVYALNWPCLTIGDIHAQIKQDLREKKDLVERRYKEYKLLLNELKKSLSPEQKAILTKINENPQSPYFTARSLLCQ